jgi:hypothetical protein
MGVSLCGAVVGIPPLTYWVSNRRCLNRHAGHCQVGSLTGAVAS